MRILLLGANSYVGARLFYDLQKDFEVTGTYSHTKLSDRLLKLDITNENEVFTIIKNVKPNIIIHAANNANARWCEANPEAAKKLNETSTKYVVKNANKIEAKVIYISSFAAIEPINIYSETKRASEEIVKSTLAGWIILRPSLIIGFSPNTINDRPFNRLLKNLDEGLKAEYDTSWKFQPSWVGHISEIIKLILEQNINKEIIPIAVKGLKTRYDIAKDILNPFEIKVSPIDNQDVTPVIEDNLNKLKELNLPPYTYEMIIIKIIEEIKHRELFKL